MKAILEACKWLDDMGNRKKAASVLTKPNYVNAPLAVIEARLMGSNDLGCDLGVQKYEADKMTFYRNGDVNAPRLSYGIWFMAQYTRFGMAAAPNYKAVADKLIMDDLYAEVAASMGISVPADGMKAFKTNLEPALFDPNNPAAYVALAKK